MQENYTDLTVILDRSGSMQSIANDMIGGLEHLIFEQRKQTGVCKVSLVQFDNEIETVFTAVDIHHLPKIDLIPRNMTALFDAVGSTIAATGERLSKMHESDRPAKVIFVIITDGLNNASVEYNSQQIAEMVKHQREVYSWEFVFIGVGAGVFEGQEIGVLNLSKEEKTAGGIKQMFGKMSDGLTRRRSASKFQYDEDVAKGNFYS